MKTVNSISGGKTSAFMAKNYPADFNVFSLVLIDAPYCSPKDKSIVRYVSEKLGFDFVATAESDRTLYVVRDLEQLIGREIVWVSGISFDKLIQKRKTVPSSMMRFCTTELKLHPIMDYCTENISDVVNMRIGFRHDESHRADRMMENNPTKEKRIIGKHRSGKNKWAEVEWRTLSFPLIEDGIGHYEIYKWSLDSGIDFPSDSNCVGCFWKPVQQLRKNFDDEPQKMRWFKEQEEKINRQWKKEMKYSDVEKIGLQQDFFFGTGSGCQAGFCTD